MNGNNKTDYEYSHHFLDNKKEDLSARNQFLKHKNKAINATLEAE